MLARYSSPCKQRYHAHNREALWVETMKFGRTILLINGISQTTVNMYNFMVAIDREGQKSPRGGGKPLPTHPATGAGAKYSCEATHLEAIVICAYDQFT